ncbi:MAG: CooT family nickel-binding protein [Deltaproteobacteria bacterium]|nr:CooT family nickel-binding protein [Deltaproteobacteria bacterium]
MCLSNVFYVDSNGQQQEVMQDVAQLEAHNNGFLLTGLLGEQKFVQGEVKIIDFVDKHSVVLGINIDKA